MKKGIVVAAALVLMAATAFAQSRIEASGTVGHSAVYLDVVHHVFHYAGCPHIKPDMERVPAAVAHLRGYAGDPDCASLTPKQHPVTLSSRAKDDATIHVLFIGNSLTFYNELPWMVERLAQSRGIALRAEFAGGSGRDLRQQWEHRDVLDAIRSRRWDWVIVQDRSMPDMEHGTFTRYTKLFRDAIEANGSKMMLFLTWARVNSPLRQSDISRAYEDAGRRLHVVVAPVGIVWDRLKPRMSLYVDDQHPNVTGTYLAACIFFSMITRESPVGLAHRFDVHYKIPEVYRASLEHDRIDAIDADVIQHAVRDELRRRDSH